MQLSRPDGTKIHYEMQGEQGPAVLLASYWSWTPGIYADLLGDLASDHRVFTFHLRGTGGSSRNGPYDMETDVGDLEAVLEAAGGSALVLGTADSANRSAKVAARRPDLAELVAAFGAGPFARASFEGEEGMLASDSVVDAYVEMLEHSYRGALRTLLEATNPQLDEEEMKQRLDAQVEFCPSEAALGRVRAWAEDDPREESQSLGGRLWILTAPQIAGAWLPSWEVRKRLTAKQLPEAHVIEFEGDKGPISRPREAAAALRRISAPLRAAAAS